MNSPRTAATATASPAKPVVLDVPKAPRVRPQPVQPKVEPKRTRLSECNYDDDCPEAPFCQRRVCYYGRCIALGASHPEKTGACVVAGANGLEHGLCLAGQCVPAARRAQACGRIYGEWVAGTPVRRPQGFCFEQPPERCEQIKTEVFEKWLTDQATALVRCIQLPETEPPGGTLRNWDGFDAEDLGSADRRREAASEDPPRRSAPSERSQGNTP